MDDVALPGLQPPAEPAPHLCHAKRCTVKVPERMLMCRRHWRMVPRWLQRQLWAVYRPGQEVTKTPSAEYLSVADRVIDYVDALERGGPAG